MTNAPTKAAEGKFRRRADARPAEVLDAALECFMRDGFEATRVEDIARAAGISKATVYLYFPSKMALLEGLVRRAIAPIAKLAESSLADFQGSARSALTLGLQVVGAKMADPETIAIPLIVLREGSRFPDIARLYHDEVLAHILPVLVGVLQKGVDSGEFRDVDPELTSRNVVGPLLMHLMAFHVFKIGDASPEGVSLLVNNHLDVLMNGLLRSNGQ